MVLVSVERAQKAHTGHGFFAEGPLPGIMITAPCRNDGYEPDGGNAVLPYVTGCASLSRRATELRRKC